jgi:hypothetical protein
MDLVENALKITNRWCKAKGLVVNPHKTNVIIFTSTVKYLGVLLDPKLNWKQHLIKKRKKLCSSVWVCRRTMGKTWRINSKLALWIYKVILLPKFPYASVVWRPMVSRVETRNLLRSLQRSYLRAAVGA